MSEEKRFAVKLDLAATCPCCSQQRAVKAAGMCPQCGTRLPQDAVTAVRAAVRARWQAFKGRLGRLSDRMHAATDGPLTFATRGAPQSKPDYFINTLRPAVKTMGERHDAVMGIFANCEWRPTESDCIKTFASLVQILDTEIDFIAQLSQTMPPLELRGVHRELTRAAAQFARGHVITAQTICAVDADEAVRLMGAAEHEITGAANHLERATDLYGLVKRSPSSNPFRTDGSLDVATLVWSVVNQEATTILDVAGLVRGAFGGMPDISQLADHYATLLVPALAVGAGVIDPEMLTARVRQLRSVIDGAGVPSSWIAQPAVLVDRIQRGNERLNDELERLGRHVQYGLPRMDVMRSQTEAYRNLVEGALRDLGSVLLIAARAGRGTENGTYETDVIDGIQAGEVVSELDSMGLPCRGAINMLYRNANAHADIEVTDTGIIATERRIEQNRVVRRDQQSLSDDEFAEELVSLQEVLLALELAIVPWLWSTADSRLAAAVASTPITKRQRDQAMAVVGGLAGLHDVHTSLDGSRIIITAEAYKDDSDRRESKILSLVPLAFGSSPDIEKVSLHIKGLRLVMFDRSEFLESAPNDAPHKLPMLGLTVAKWLLKSESAWTECDEATYATFPLTMLFFACCKLAGSTPPRTGNIDEAVRYLEPVLARLDDVLPTGRRSRLTRQAVELATSLVTGLKVIAESRRGQKSPAEGERQGQKIAAGLQPMYEIQEVAKALRDSKTLLAQISEKPAYSRGRCPTIHLSVTSTGAVPKFWQLHTSR
jgi:hypothetical protein